MTKEQILERIKQLETEREQMKHTLSAYEGAIQDCQHWLKQIEQASPALTQPEVAKEEHVEDSPQ